MNRHQPHQPLAEYQGNLAPVRRGLSASPQTVFSVFKLSPTSYGLEMRMPLNRIRGSLIASIMRSRADQSTRFDLWAIVGMALFVGGSVALTGSAMFGIIVAAVLPMLLWLITFSEKLTRQEEVVLRLVNTPDGNTFLSMSAAAVASRGLRHASADRSSRGASSSGSYSPCTYSATQQAASPAVYFSNLPVKLVSASTTVASGQISFTLYRENAYRGNRLRITGSRQEIRWLHARIAKWGKGRQEERESRNK